MNLLPSIGFKHMVMRKLSEEEAEEFAGWAFGEDYLTLQDMINFAKAWNERHGDLYRVKYEDQPSKDLERMVDLWKEHNEKRT